MARGVSKGSYGPSGRKNSYVPSNKPGQNARDDSADASGALKSLKSENPKSVGEKMSEDDDLPDGKLCVNHIKAKELIKWI